MLIFWKKISVETLLIIANGHTGSKKRKYNPQHKKWKILRMRNDLHLHFKTYKLQFHLLIYP